MALASAFSQGCAAVGVTLLGSAASAATGAGASYALGSKAHKTFTAPISQVKTNVLTALGDMGFPIETDEKTDGGQRLVARVDGREVEVELEPVTPKTTKVVVVVRQGLFWKDRATAEEILEQTARGVDVVVMAAKAAAAAAATRRTAAEGELRPAASMLDPWDPLRWREGFAAAPAPPPVVDKIQVQATKAEAALLPVSQPPPPVVALGGGRAAAPETSRSPDVHVARATLTTPERRSNPAQDTDGGDNPWRVVRTVRLRTCPGTECDFGATLKRGDVVVRLRERDQWWRVWLAGTDVLGWISPDDLAPQRWWDPSKRPVAASAR